MKKVNANAHIEVLCSCPYCNAFEDVFENVKDSMSEEIRTDNINIEVKCSECKKPFLIENILH